MNNFVIRDFEGVLDDYKHGLYDFTKDGKCSECGGCCSNILPMTNKEINTIRRYIANHHIERQYHGVFALAKVAFDLQCPFLDLTRSEHKCLIYEVRPLVCREFQCNCWTMEKQMKVIREPVYTVNCVNTFYPGGQNEPDEKSSRM